MKKELDKKLTAVSLAIRAAQPLVSTAEFKLRPRPSMKKMKVKVTQSCPTLLQHHGLYSPWNSPGQNARVGSLSLLQGIFPTQGSNPGLPHCRWILYQLSHKGSPRIWSEQPISSPGHLPDSGINWGLLHCRWILYQLSYQGSPSLIYSKYG